MARGLVLYQGLNSCLLHWQADSLPLSHQGSPKVYFFSFFFKKSSPLLLEALSLARVGHSVCGKPALVWHARVWVNTAARFGSLVPASLLHNMPKATFSILSLAIVNLIFWLSVFFLTWYFWGFFFFFDVDHFKSLYWICYNVACCFMFWFLTLSHVGF